MPPLWFESEIPASERPQTYALDRAATGTGCNSLYDTQFSRIVPLIILEKPFAGRDNIVAGTETLRRHPKLRNSHKV
jgi:hypothetical protein